MYIGEGNSNPLDYSCLENPVDRGARWFIVHGVARVGHNWATKPPQCIYVHPNLPFYPSHQSPGNHVCFLHLWLQKTYFRCAVASGVQQLMFSHLFRVIRCVWLYAGGLWGTLYTETKLWEFLSVVLQVPLMAPGKQNTTWCVLEAVF